MTDTTTHVPLSKLVAWEGNVRKTSSAEGLQELAASIHAHGLLQSLVVREAKKGRFTVVAGNRRLTALLMLSAQGKLDADHLVPCQVLKPEADATEISLAENAVREQMHPADEFEAFRELADKGKPAADIAARFGVTETVVQKRLKLARVAPSILAAYRKDELTLEQVMAFAVSDDHAAQERVFANLEGWRDSASHIRHALTQDEIAADDRRVKFVTLKAYEKAGGMVRRDLFSTDEAGVFIENPQLLAELCQAKLEKRAKTIAKEGWKWVEVREEFDHSEWQGCERRYEEDVPLPPELEAELETLQAEAEKLEREWGDSDEEDVTERFDEIQKRIGAIEDSQQQIWPPKTLAIAGAVVFLDYDGDVEIRRGLVLPADKPKTKPKAAAAETADADGKLTGEAQEAFTLSASLIEILTAHKSAAITAVLMEEPEIALAALAHALAGRVIYGTGRVSCLEIAATVEYNRLVGDSPAARAIEAKHQAWTQKLPGSLDDVWAWCLKQTTSELLALIAYCAARTVDATMWKGAAGNAAHGEQLARALDLDMQGWFKPTAENYFGKISKSGILQALNEGKGAIAPAWSGYKKAELAALAERELCDTDWLPEPLRAGEPERDRLSVAA